MLSQLSCWRLHGPVLSQPLKRRPVNLSFFIPLPAGLVEIKRRACRPRCWGAGIFHPGVRVDKPQLSRGRWTGACSDQYSRGSSQRPLSNPLADPLILWTCSFTVNWTFTLILSDPKVSESSLFFYVCLLLVLGVHSCIITLFTFISFAHDFFSLITWNIFNKSSIEGAFLEVLA